MLSNRKLLKKEIESELTELSVMESGSEEKNRAITGISTLYKLDLDEKNRRNDLIDKALGHAIGVAGVAATAFIGLLGVRWRADFEREGVITGRAYDELGKVLNHILPKKH